MIKIKALLLCCGVTKKDLMVLVIIVVVAIVTIMVVSVGIIYGGWLITLK